MRILSAFLVVCSLLVLPACGYSLAGRGSFLPEYIRTVGIPLFVNNSPLIEADRILTEKVRTEFVSRGKFTAVDRRTDVDALLVGEITGISLQPAGLNQNQQATRYAVIVTAKLEFTDVKANKVLWANPAMQFRDEFDVTTASSATDASAFFGANANALDRLGTEFARAIVSAIVEAF